MIINVKVIPYPGSARRPGKTGNLHYWYDDQIIGGPEACAVFPSIDFSARLEPCEFPGSHLIQFGMADWCDDWGELLHPVRVAGERFEHSTEAFRDLVQACGPWFSLVTATEEE